jgi:hypothetical protein
MINLNPTLTSDGLALFTGQQPGFNVAITHIAFGGQKYDPSGFESALKQEFVRYPVDGGTTISPSSIQVGVLLTNSAPDNRSANDKWIGEIGFYSGNTLFAVLSHAAAYLFYKSPDIPIPVTYVLDFSVLPPGSITVNNDAQSADIALQSSYAQEAAQTALNQASVASEQAAVARAMAEATSANASGFVSDYAALRTYTGPAKRVDVTGMVGTAVPVGIAGMFIRRDDLDPASAVDNGGTRIVGAAVWDRVYEGGVNPEWFQAIGDGVADDTDELQATLDVGGTINLKRKLFITSRPLVLSKRQTRLCGVSLHETYIKLQMTVVDRGNWAVGVNYAVNDLVRTPDGLPYFCKTAHLSGATFSADWAAARWEVYAVISVRASDCECANFYAPVPAKAVGIAVQGAARFNPHNVNLAPRDTSSGIGILLDDRDYLGTFKAGSYTHTIGPGNLIAVTTQGVRQFEYGILTAGTTGGINATRILSNGIVGDQPVSLVNGGGNTMAHNLIQSFSGANSGARPYTGGVGTGVYFNGGLNAVCNYFERFAADFKSSGASYALLTVDGHNSDASNAICDANGGPLPAFVASSNGIAAFRFDDLINAVALTGDNQVISTKTAGLYVHGGTTARTGITLSTAGAKEGQVFVLKNNSWPIELVQGGTADFGQAGATLPIGQQGQLVNGNMAACDVAVFMFLNGKWCFTMAHWYGPGPGTYQAYNVTANAVQVPILAQTMMLSGNGADRTGATLAAGARYGQPLTLCGSGYAVAFAAGAAIWLNNSPPNVGNGSTKAISSDLVYTSAGWLEKQRHTRP